METRTALKKTELVFKINEDFIEITADGRRATSKELNVVVNLELLAWLKVSQVKIAFCVMN